MTNSINKYKRANLSDWLVGNLRLTLFTTPYDFSLERTYWQSLMGQPAEKRTISAKTLVINEEGPFENGMLKFGSNPTRIDWILVSDPTRGGGEEKPSLFVGSLESVKESFVKLMLEWLPSSPPLHRMAFGVVLHLPVNNREEGYRRIAPYMDSVKLDAEGSSDFLYQINRPRKSLAVDIPDFKINRLSQWSVVSSTPLQIEIGSDQITAGKGKEEYTCCLALDINTPLGFEGQLPSVKAPEIFKELVDLGMEIVREGDIP
jgi:hypothetical protein